MKTRGEKFTCSPTGKRCSAASRTCVVPACLPLPFTCFLSPLFSPRTQTPLPPRRQRRHLRRVQQERRRTRTLRPVPVPADQLLCPRVQTGGTVGGDSAAEGKKNKERKTGRLREDAWQKINKYLLALVLCFSKNQNLFCDRQGIEGEGGGVLFAY